MSDFAIISNNCWGYQYYTNNSLEYNTPFVGLFIFAPDYIYLLENFYQLIDHPLEPQIQSKYGNFSYPIGKLTDNVEIHFLHYPTFIEAADKWNRRLERLPRDKSKLLFKFDDRDRCTQDLFNRFHALPLPFKLSFARKEHFILPTTLSSIHVDIPHEDCEETCVPHGVILYSKTPQYFNLQKLIQSIINKIP
jgi:uncharacterized protein (DUF1919 family)